MVRAKTGNLTTVAALAGMVYARNGQLLSFAFMADRLPSGEPGGRRIGHGAAGDRTGRLRLPVTAGEARAVRGGG